MVKKKTASVKITNSNTTQVNNGLSDIIGGGVINMFDATQLSEIDTIFKNNRWYMLSNMRQVLSQVYVEHGIIQTLIDAPVDDAFRGGIEITTKQLDQSDIDSLQATIEEMGLLEHASQAMKWTRLYGGGGIVLMTGQKHDTPIILSQEALKYLQFHAVDMWELFATQQNIDDGAMKLEIKKDPNFCYNYYSLQLHNSRVLPIKGREAPSFIRPRLRGWGFSVVESLVQSINQYFKAKNLSFEVLDEFKLDIFKIKNFNVSLATSSGTEAMLKRVQLANQQKNYQNALTMDSEDDHISKQLNFSGISDVMKEIRMQIASDMRMPMSKLFGIASSGFSSGEDDIEVYNSMVESQVRFKAKKPVTEMVKMACIKEFGFAPSDLKIDFKPLRILSSEQEENVKTQRLNRVKLANDSGLCSGQEAKQSINKDNLISVKVDETTDTDFKDETPESGQAEPV